MGIDKASILADRYKNNRGQLAAALMGQPVQDQSIDAYSALRAMQLLKESDRMAMAQQARGPSGEQPSLAEAAVAPDQSMGLAGMAGQPVMAQAQQAPQAMPGPEMQAASGGLASMPMADDDYAEGGIVAFAAGGRPSSADYLEKAFANIPKPTSLAEREAGMTKQRDYVNTLYGEDRMAPFLEDIAKERRELSGNKDKNLGYALLAAAKAVVDKPSTGKGLSSIVPGLAAAGAAFGSEMQKFEKEEREAKRALRQSEMTLAAAQQARNDGKTDKAVALFNKYDDQDRDAKKMLADVNLKAADMESGIEKARLTAQVAREGHAVQREGFNRPGEVERELAIQEKNLGRPFTTEERVAARAKLYEGQYGSRYTGLGGDKTNRITGDFQKDLRERTEIFTLQKQMRNVPESEIEDIDRKIERERLRLIEEYKASGVALTGKAPAGGAPTAQQAAPISVTSKEQFAKLPSGTTFVAPDGSVRIKP
jgi:hypothetical protein